MDRLRIRWNGPHHTGDDLALIRQALDIADDEGPLIAVPIRRRDRPASKAGLAYGAQVFENPLWLISHLAEYGPELEREFMLGICEDVPERGRAVAISGLCKVKALLNDMAGLKRAGRMPKPVREQAERFAAMTQGTVPEPPLTAFSLIVEHDGDQYEEMAKSFPDLAPVMLISAA